MNTVGIKALKTFKAKGSVEMRKKYPSIYRKDTKDTNKKPNFNPNNDYLYFSDKEKDTKLTLPWYGFTLIPDTTNKERSSVDTSLYLMQFLNWAIYYYEILTSDYNSIPKGRPKQNNIIEAQKQTKTYSNLYLKRNSFPLKPPYFLKLCRFFVRAWYEEKFCTPDNATSSVEFAHYISNYIEASLVSDADYNCKRYNGNNDNHKKEVTRLFKKEGKIQYSYRNFHIFLEKYGTKKQKNASYSISISQYGCNHTFYLFSRLYQYRYTSAIQ